MIETIYEIMNTTMYSELGGIAYLAGFFSFLLIPYGAMAITERKDRSVETLDRVYDLFAVGTAAGIIWLGINVGTEGILAVIVGVGITITLYAALVIGLVITVGVTNLLTRRQKAYKITKE